MYASLRSAGASYRLGASASFLRPGNALNGLPAPAFRNGGSLPLGTTTASSGGQGTSVSTGFLSSIRLGASAAPNASFHTSAAAEGGRHTNTVPERVLHWKKHISKKAQKRYKKQKERNLEENKKRQAAAAAGQAGSQQTALMAPEILPALPGPSELASMSAQNRVIIESFLAPVEDASSQLAADGSGARRTSGSSLLASSSYNPEAGPLNAEEADTLLQALKAGTVDRDRETVQIVMRSFAAQGRFEDVISLFSTMRREWSLAPDTSEYNYLILSLAQQRNKDGALSVYQSMVSADVAVNDVTFGALMQACIRAGDLSSAFQQLQLAERAGVPLTAVLFTHLIVGCIHAGQYERAWLVFDHMRERHGIEADSVCYTSMITACAKRDEVERAVNLVTEMKQLSVPLTAVTYNAVIHAAARSFRKASVAHTLFSEMGVEGFKRDDRTYTSVITACSHTGDVVRARMYLYEMAKEGVKPSLYTLNALLSVYMRALRPDSKNEEKDGDAKALTLSDAKAKELLQLEEPDSAANLLAGRKRELGEYARIIEGDPNQLAENLLADYFSADSGVGARKDSGTGNNASEAGALAEAASESGTQASLIAAERDAIDSDPFVPANAADQLLPKVHEYNQDLSSPEYQQAKEVLVREIGVDPALFEQLEAENSRPIPLDSDEDAAALEVQEREDRVAKLKSAAKAMEMMKKGSDIAAERAQIEQEALAFAEQHGIDLNDTPLARSMARKAAQAAALRTEGVLAVGGLDGVADVLALTDGQQQGSSNNGGKPLNKEQALEKFALEMAADALAGRTIFDDVMMGVKLKMGLDPLANPFDGLKSPAIAAAKAKAKEEAVDGKAAAGSTDSEADELPRGRIRSRRLQKLRAAAGSTAEPAAAGESSALVTTEQGSASTPIVAPSATPHGTATGLIEAFLPSPAADGRLKFKDYLKAVEKSVEAQVFAEAGPLAPSNIVARGLSEAANKAVELLTSSASPALTGAATGDAAGLSAKQGALTVGGNGGSKMTVQEARAILARQTKAARNSSLFDSDDEGGSSDDVIEVAEGRGRGRNLRRGTVSLNKLMDIRDIPLPETSDADGEHDPIKLHDYYAEKTARRVMEALEKEEALVAEAEEVVMRANGLMNETEIENLIQERRGSVASIAALDDAEQPALITAGAASDWSNSDFSDVEAGRSRGTRQRAASAVPAIAGKAAPSSSSSAPSLLPSSSSVAASSSPTVVAAASSFSSAPSSVPFATVPIAMSEGGGAESVRVASGAAVAGASTHQALPRPQAPQKPILPPELAHAAVDDAGNILLERVATTTTTRIDGGVAVVGSAPEGSRGIAAAAPGAVDPASISAASAVADAASAAVPGGGLVRRRRSGTPLSPTAFMPRPANFAPSIATDLPPLPEEGDTTNIGGGDLSAAEGGAAEQSSGLATAVITTADASAASLATDASSSDAAAADALTLAQQNEELVTTARREVAGLLLPSPADSGNAIFKHLDPKAARKEEEAMAASGGNNNDGNALVVGPEELGDLTPEQYNHPLVQRRRIIRRAMANMLRTEVLPRLERSLVLAAEDVKKYRKRRATQSQPTTMDALMAVQTLKDKAEEAREEAELDRQIAALQAEVAAREREIEEIKRAQQLEGDDEAPEVASAAATSAAAAAATAGGASRSSLGPMGSEGDDDDEEEEELSPGQKRHLARQDAALQVAAALTTTTSKAGKADTSDVLQRASRGENHMTALVQMSDRLLSGAHWLPMGGAAGSISKPGSLTSPAAYPEARGERKAALLQEAENIYRHEIQENLGLTPDLVTLNTMLNAYCTAGMTKQAYAFLKEEYALHGIRPDARTFRSLISMHVKQRNGGKAEKVFALARQQGIEPDKDSYGLIVHLRAREYRLKDSIELLKEMKAKGIECSEHYAFLVRQRCKELGIYHEAVPAHPVGWQFTPKVMEKRRSQSKLGAKLAKFMRPKIGKYS